MRRIKTYVMTVGVALSVAPIFNYALAQQGSNATQLLLDVQTMRQEIAELRDMVERQQFQLKRLQRQVEAQAQQSGQVQGFDNRSSNNIGQPSYNGSVLPSGAPTVQNGAPFSQSATQAGNPSQQPLSTGIAQGAANTGTTGGVDQKTSWNVDNSRPSDQNTDDFYRPNTPNQAANQNAYSSSVPTQQTAPSNYPPVVDRSFSTTSSTVPITGAGTRQQAGSNAFQNAPSSQTQPDQQAYNSRTQGQEYQASRQPYQEPQAVALEPQQGGVVAIPPQAGAQINQAPVNASQIPVAPKNSNSQVASTQAPTAAVTSEDDYYDQGFELLKQSKYEEAASIFEQQLEAHPRGDLADDAHYWIAEAMHVSRKLDVAKVHLKAIVSDYPQSRRLPDAMLKIAYIEQSQGNQIEARMLFQDIVNQHPQSDAAIAARNQLAAAN